MDIGNFEKFLIEQHATAIHEAGHAVAGELLGFPCRYIRGLSYRPIKKEWSSGLWTHDRRTTRLLRIWPNSEKSFKQHADYGVAVAAGVAAEAIDAGIVINDDLRAVAGSGDYKGLATLACRISVSQVDLKTLKPIRSEESLIAEWEGRATALLKENWAWVESVACLLDFEERVSGDDMRSCRPRKLRRNVRRAAQYAIAA